MHRLRFLIRRLRERLWLKPLTYGLAAVAASVAAQAADRTDLAAAVPDIAAGTLDKLLTIIATTMLAVATFAVGSMLSAYATATQTATPRAFELVVADDQSKTALSSFVGAFIFAVVGLVALDTGLYERGGRFALFLMTAAVFAWVILTFVRWVDGIARLGRMGATIDKLEAAAGEALAERRRRPHLGGVAPETLGRGPGAGVEAGDIGYVLSVDMEALQSAAEACDAVIRVEAPPGTFLHPGRPAATVLCRPGAPDEALRRRISDAFLLGPQRTFAEDPRFGLVVLAEVAGRALSPGVNDPGTAIAVIGRFVRLLSAGGEEAEAPRYDRVAAPAAATADVFDDAFTAIARDGAGVVEVGTRLQKAFLALAVLPDAAMRREARRHSRLALARAETALTLEADRERLRALADRVSVAAAGA